jgi:hypothetical protein
MREHLLVFIVAGILELPFWGELVFLPDERGGTAEVAGYYFSGVHLLQSIDETKNDGDEHQKTSKSSNDQAHNKEVISNFHL